MKALKYRDKYVQMLRKELIKVYSRSTLLNVRRSVRKANTYLNEIGDFLERYDPVILAVKSVKIKNIYLARAVQNERERSNKLLQEKLEVQSAYHDALKDKAELKKELWNLEQTIISELDDLKSVLPNIVELSENYTKRMVKYDLLRKNISAKRKSDSLPPRNFSNISFGANSNQPVSAVNPMIKGCVIQKPTISVRRVPFPNETRTSMFDYVNINSPILEEPEENIDPVNNTLNRRCENGLRHAMNVTNRRGIRRPEPSVQASADYCDSVNRDSQMNVQMEPVVRLEDVTRLLQNSSFSLRISETEAPNVLNQNTHLNESVHEHCSPEVMLRRISTPVRSSLNNVDNALEGCSWMYQGASTNTNNEIEPTSTQGNTCCYQSRVQLTPNFVRNTCTNNHKYSNTTEEVNQRKESSYFMDETHSQSYRSGRKFFPSCKSPFSMKSSLGSPRHSNKMDLSEHTNDVRESTSHQDLDNDNDAVLVSSSNQILDSNDMGNSASTTTCVTRRKRKKTEQMRLSRRRSQTNNGILENVIEAIEEKRSLRPRKSVRTSRITDHLEKKVTENNTETRKCSQRKNSDKDKEMKDMISENDTLESGQSRTVRNNSSRRSSSASSTDSENSIRKLRSVRNRGSVSYKEPSLNVKLRRNT